MGEWERVGWEVGLGGSQRQVKALIRIQTVVLYLQYADAIHKGGPGCREGSLVSHAILLMPQGPYNEPSWFNSIGESHL